MNEQPNTAVLEMYQWAIDASNESGISLDGWEPDLVGLPGLESRHEYIRNTKHDFLKFEISYCKGQFDIDIYGTDGESISFRVTSAANALKLFAQIEECGIID